MHLYPVQSVGAGVLDNPQVNQYKAATATPSFPTNRRAGVYSRRMSLPYPIKPNFSICFKGFSQIAKTVSHAKKQICIILAENGPKYTEKASIFFHFFLACLIFPYAIDAKTVSLLPRNLRPAFRAASPVAPSPCTSLLPPGVRLVGHPECPKGRQKAA